MRPLAYSARGISATFRSAARPAAPLRASIISAVQPHSQNNRLVLVDANALLYRIKYAYGSKLLTTKRGEDTSIPYGFLKSILGLLELQPPPTHMAVVFDAKGKNFRHEIFPGYKAHRPPMPEEIKQAGPRIRQLLSTLGISQLSTPGIEADDVIGCVVHRAKAEGFAVVIASPDKDFFQLLQKNVTLLRPPKGGDGKKALAGGHVPYTLKNFEADYELMPCQWPDVLAIWGDSADNVPGVPGIGEKGALELVREFGSVENILARSSEVKKKRQRTILESEEGAAAARLGLELVKIQTDLRIPSVRMPLAELCLKPPTEQQINEVNLLMEELEFKEPVERLAAIWAEMNAS